LRFVFVNRFYWPDEPATAQLLTDLAEALAARGHSVSVIASHPGGDTPSAEQRRGVAIVRVRVTRLNRCGLLGKLADFTTFYVGCLIGLIVQVRPGDIVVALTDPPLLGAGVWLAARLRRSKVIHWAQDIYPEVAVALTGNRWLGVFAPLRDLAWRRAEACVTLGSDMKRVLSRAGVEPRRLTVIPNWAPAGLDVQPAGTADALRKKWELVGKFVVLYSGNLGRVHDLAPLLDVAERLRAQPHIVFVFVGRGAQLATLQARTDERKLKNIRFQSPQPRDQLATALSLGDLHLLTLLPGCESFVFPSKLYGIAAVGRPILFVGPPDCEIATLIKARRIGRTFSRGETVAMADTITGLSFAPTECAALGNAASKFSADGGGLETAVRKWATLAESLEAT
jgi:colanic acid biosynthesis glycosyl transferase WcaI